MGPGGNAEQSGGARRFRQTQGRQEKTHTESMHTYIHTYLLVCGRAACEATESIHTNKQTNILEDEFARMRSV
eukprot:12071191-Heterocapsa_arctica.AAC.1